MSVISVSMGNGTNTFHSVGKAGKAGKKRYFRKVKASDPVLAKKYYELGMRSFYAEEIKKAKGRFQTAVDLDPTNVEARFALACTLESTDMTEEAIFHFREVLLIKPDHYLAQTSLANLLAKLGEEKLSLYHFNEARKIRTDLAHIYHDLAWMIDDPGDLGRRQYQAKLRSDPNDPETHYHLANKLYFSGLRERADQHYKEALRGDSEKDEVLQDLSVKPNFSGDNEVRMGCSDPRSKSCPDGDDKGLAPDHIFGTGRQGAKLDRTIERFSTQVLVHNPLEKDERHRCG